MVEITPNQRFILKFKCRLSNLKDIELMLKEYKGQAWSRLPFDAWIEYKVEVNIHQAEVVRRLIKNMTSYD